MNNESDVSFACLDSIHLARNEMTARLVRWADQNSGSLNPEGLRAMQDLVREDFSVLPGRMDVIELPPGSPAGSCGILRIVNRPEAPIQVLLNGHLDTVFGPDSPFQKCTVLDAERIKGPGITDMKGGLVVMLAALQAFEACPWRERIGWEVLISPDEELGSPHSTPFLQEAARRHHLGMVFESSLPDGQLVRARMGVGAYRFEVRGRAAHVGRDFDAGRNAIDGLSEILLKASDLNRSGEGVIVNVGRIEGGGPINVVPDRAVADLNVRVWRREQMADLEELLRACGSAVGGREGFEVEFSGGFSRGPKEVSPEIEALFGALCNCGRSIGLEFGWRDTGGGSDGNILAMEGLPNVDSLGVRGEFIHSDQEYVLVDSLAERASLSSLFLMRLARGELELPASILERSIERTGEAVP
ncbi:MAG: hydrolase [Verrucomicrobia bacterium]|nr:MAG: hydrolase [Verrucomicrobiota bacterium]